MKKFVALLFIFIGVLVFALTGCSNNDIFTEKSYSSGEIEKISVEVENREVEIVVSNDNQIHIDYFDGEKEYLDISVSENGELTIKIQCDKNWSDFISMKSEAKYRKINIKIPNNMINEVSVKTTNANIKATSLSIKENILLDSNGGDIVCDRINVGKSISLKAKNGNISGSVIGGWDDFSIVCKIKKGDSNLTELKEGGIKSFSADCNNGDINIEFIK